MRDGKRKKDNRKEKKNTGEKKIKRPRERDV